MANQEMQTKYVGGKPSWLEKQMNSIFGGDPNTAGYEPIYAEGTPDYEKQEYQHGGDPDMNTTSPIGYRKLMYGSPAPIGLDQEEMAAQAGGEVANNMYESPLPPVTGIQAATPNIYEAGPGRFNEIFPDTNIGMGAEYGTSGENAPTANVDNSLNQGIADLASMGITSGSMSGGGGPSSLASMGPNPELDVPVFQEAPVIDYSPDPMNQAFAPNQNMSVLDRISQLLGIGDNPDTVVSDDLKRDRANLNTAASMIAPVSGVRGVLNAIQPSQAIQQIGDGLGEAGTEMDMPAGPQPSANINFPAASIQDLSDKPQSAPITGSSLLSTIQNMFRSGRPQRRSSMGDLTAVNASQPSTENRFEDRKRARVNN